VARVVERVYSAFCPNCVVENAPPKSACDNCQTSCVWSTVEERDADLASIRRDGRGLLLRAAGILFIALLTFVVPLLSAARAHIPVKAIIASTFGAVVLIGVATRDAKRGAQWLKAR
jgi:hypothetical protein